jgi:hypothetical protein
MDQSIIDSRMAVCNRCEFMIDGDCSFCGCELISKCSDPEQFCPDTPSRWGIVDANQPPTPLSEAIPVAQEVPKKKKAGGCASCQARTK